MLMVVEHVAYSVLGPHRIMSSFNGLQEALVGWIECSARFFMDALCHTRTQVGHVCVHD